MKIETPESIFNGKNLLGFSGGVDSSALFFLLIENNIDFDIAIVDYNLRNQSKTEVAYAKELAEKYSKKIFVLESYLNNVSVEANARKIRYDFFTDLIQQNEYNGLILAHQLNDKLEWLLMKMAQGAGLSTLSGFEAISNDRGFNIFRPLIFTSRDDIQSYLNERHIKFFIDESNLECKYTRNRYRNAFVNDFVSENSKGIINSFKMLSSEKKALYPNADINNYGPEGFLFRYENMTDDQIVFNIDKIFKNKFQYVLSSNQRNLLKERKFSIVFREYSVAISDIYVFVFKTKECALNNKQKEFFRINKIPILLRKYIAFHDIF